MNPVDLSETDLKYDTLDAGARRLARKRGISEGELVASRVGKDVVRLGRPAELLQALPSLGTVLAVTRNEYVIHRKVGRYGNISIGPERGMVLNHDIDLRLVMRHWRHAFAVTYECSSTSYSSLQFFDCHGEAVHKIWMLDASEQSAFNDLVREFAEPVQERGLAVEPKPDAPGFLQDGQIDRDAFHARWAALEDTHDFNRLLKTFKIERHQALRLIGPEFARQVARDATRRMVLSVAAAGTPILVFAGNAGCLQIHTGPIENVAPLSRRWLGIRDPLFHLSLRENRIGSSWVVRKPTRDGVLTSLEIFDSSGELMVQFFGARDPGMLERQEWRKCLSELPMSTERGNPE
jgi:putative hemin transport protein